jgi:hypothetical protein
MTDTEAALRDALAFIAETLAVPDNYDDESDAAMAERQAWRESCSDRAIHAGVTIEYILKPGVDIADHIRYLREKFAPVVQAAAPEFPATAAEFEGLSDLALTGYGLDPDLTYADAVAIAARARDHERYVADLDESDRIANQD